MMITGTWEGCKLSNENGALKVTAQEMLDIATYVAENKRELEAVVVIHTPGIDDKAYEEACASLADIGEQESLRKAEEAAERYFATGSASSFIPAN